MSLSLDWEPNDGTDIKTAFDATKEQIGNGLITVYLTMNGVRIPINRWTLWEDYSKEYNKQHNSNSDNETKVPAGAYIY